MFIYIITPFILLLLCCQSVYAKDLSSDEFISSYDPENVYEVNVQLKTTNIGRYMPSEKEAFVSNSGSKELSDTLVMYPENKLPVIQLFVTNSFLQVFTQTQMMMKQLHIKIGALLNTAKKQKKTEQEHDLQRRSRVINGIVLPPPLHKPKLSSYFSGFSVNPYGKEVSNKVKEVYTWDTLWNPHYNPSFYLQCTTYVAMIYNLNNISLKGKVHGDANQWITFTNVFEVYRSGTSTVAPSSMDVAVWAGEDMNHVGVIVEVTNKTFRVVNANADKPMYTFKWSQDEHGVITITNLRGETSEDAWVPTHWLRYKK